MENKNCSTRSENGMFIRDHARTGKRGTILYVHGLGESGLCFEHLLAQPALSAWRQVIPDLPGYGRSLWTDPPLPIDKQADKLAHWLEESVELAEASPLMMVGHSMGSVIGLRFCEMIPDRVAAFVDVEGNKSSGDCNFSGRAAGQSIDQFLNGGFDALRTHVFNDAANDPAKRGYYASLRLADPRAFHLNSQELVEMSRPEDMAARLAALPLATYYIAAIPNGVCARTHQLLSQAGIDYMRIEPSGHWPFIDQTDQFVDALANILRDVS